jgi:hypothetical protein
VKTTYYYREDVLPERPYLKTYAQYVARALVAPVSTKAQSDGRSQCWIYVPEEDKYLRVVVLADGETVHNAFFDRNFRRRMKK